MDLSPLRSRNVVFIALGVAAVGLSLTLAAHRDAFGEPEAVPPRHVLVELFTSQG